LLQETDAGGVARPFMSHAADRPTISMAYNPAMFRSTPAWCGRVEGREAVAAFDAGAVTSDAGALLLSRPVEQSGGRHLLAAKLRPAGGQADALQPVDLSRLSANVSFHIRCQMR
jgi:hypothetical protein